MLYDSSPTQVSVNFNAAQITAGFNVDATVYHCYIVVVNGGSSVLYVDGVGTAGALGAGNLTAQYIGKDNGNAFNMVGNVEAFACWSYGLSADEAFCVTSRERAQFFGLNP